MSDQRSVRERLLRELYETLTQWVVTEFPFGNPYFSNRELPELGGRR